MSKLRLDDLLADSRPERLSSDPAIQLRLAELAAATKPSRTRSVPLWKRKHVLLPAVAFVILATTAGGVVAQWAQNSDVAIPVSYTTDTGDTINCTFAITVSSGLRRDGSHVSKDVNVSALRKFMQTNNWSGLGQQSYDRAIDSSWTPAGGMPGVALFNRAATEEISQQIPEALLGDGISWGAGSDCSGRLH
jgi:hypothetical protein